MSYMMPSQMNQAVSSDRAFSCHADMNNNVNEDAKVASSFVLLDALIIRIFNLIRITQDNL